MHDQDASLSGLVRSDPDKVAALIGATADIVLVLDRDDLIAGVHGRLSANGFRTWRGRSFPDVLAPDSRSAAEGMVLDLRAGRAVASAALRHAAAGRPDVDMAYSGVLVAGSDRIMLAGREESEDKGGAPADAKSRYRSLFEIGSGIAELVSAAGEPMVLADRAGRLLVANDAFLAAAGVAIAARVVGRGLGDFLDLPAMTVAALLSRVDRAGRLRVEGAVLRAEGGTEMMVDVSVVTMREGYGVVMSPAGTPRAESDRDLPAAMEGLADRIGRVPMKDLVRDTTDAIERLCIESALDLTGNNRAAAARVLGMSRQALYLKLERYGLL